MKLGLVLSGGGARGIAHIGALQALEEMQIEFSVVSGTSAGSIVGAMYAYGYKPKEIFDIVKYLSIFKTVRPAWTWAGLLTIDGIRDLLLKHIPENNFSALKLPLTIAATEVQKGQIHYFTEGELIPAVICSSSIPAVFSPVTFNGGVYIDGGLLDNLPVKPIKKQCDFIVGLHCNNISAHFAIGNVKKMIERSLLLAINANTQISRSMCDVFIDPPNLDRFGVMDIARAQEIYDAGYQFTKANFLPHHFQREYKA